MNSIVKKALIVLFFLAGPFMVWACEIAVSVDGVQKGKYKAGDVVIMRVEVRLVHRNCQVDIEKTDIATSGLQIVGATRWVNTEGNRWERRIKVKITANHAGKVSLTADRSCRKEGGHASLTLPV